MTMMREFQAENERHQTTLVEHNTPSGISPTSDKENLPLVSNHPSTSIVDKQQELSDIDLNQLKMNVNTTESRVIADKNKITVKPTSRLMCDTLSVRLHSLFCI